MKKLLLVLVEVLNLEHSIPRGISTRLTTELLVRCRTFLGRSPTPKPVHTEFESPLLGSPKRGDSVVYCFARAFYAPDLHLSFLSSERMLSERGRFKSAPSACNRYADLSIRKSQTAHAALFEDLNRWLSNGIDSNRLSPGYRVQLRTQLKVSDLLRSVSEESVFARDCELVRGRSSFTRSFSL